MYYPAVSSGVSKKYTITPSRRRDLRCAPTNEWGIKPLSASGGLKGTDRTSLFFC